MFLKCQAEIDLTAIHCIACEDVLLNETELRSLSDVDLESLASKTRSITERSKLSFTTATTQRDSPASDLTSEFGGKKFHSCLQRIRTYGRLDKRAAKCIELAVKILTTEQTGRYERLIRTS